MFTSISPDATRVVECPWDGEPRTKFRVLVSLPYDVRAEIKDRFSSYSRQSGGNTVEYQYHFSERSIEIVRHGLKGLENFAGVACELVPEGKRYVVAPGVLQALSRPLAQEGFDTLLDWLASEIWKGSDVSEEEAKVFPLQSAR